MWTLAFGHHEYRRRPTATRQHAKRRWRRSRKAGGGNKSGRARESSVHFPEVRPVNRFGRRSRRIARTFWDSSPCCNRQKRCDRKSRCEDKWELMLVRCHPFPPGSQMILGPLLQGHRLDICDADQLNQSIGIDSPWGLRRCRKHCLVTCVSALSKQWKRGRRGVRRPSALRSAPVLRSNGCNAGVITGCVHRNRAVVADLFWKTMPRASLP